MQAHPQYILSELKKLILEELEQNNHIMQNGDSFVIPDFPTYKEYVGKISALRRVLTFFDEAQTNAEKMT